MIPHTFPGMAHSGSRLSSIIHLLYNKCMFVTNSKIVYHKYPYTQVNKLLIQQMVTGVFYYLSNLCVSKYQNVLSAIKNEEKQEAMQNKPAPSPNKPFTRQASAANTMIVQRSMLQPESTAETPSTDREEPHELETVQEVEEPLIPSSLSLHAHALDISEQIEAAVSVVGPFLCQLLVEHRSSLSKVLVGADGRVLISEGEILLLALCICFGHTIFDCRLLYISVVYIGH